MPGSNVDRLLVVEDDPVSRKLLRRILGKAGYDVETASDGAQALSRLESHRFSLVITDLVMTPVGGLEVLERARDRDPEVEVIIVTGHGSVPTAVEAMRKKAFHYLLKPFRPEEVLHHVTMAIEKRRMRRTLERVSPITRSGELPIVGESAKILAVKGLIRQVAPTRSNVLITGASGTGKELVALSIQRLSDRAERPFVPINCASFTEDLLSNELFGHEKDAYTGASTSRAGLLETADGGTVFFDEVGDMPLAMQARLLRVVQERELIRVGGSKPIKVDLRIISATNKDLKRAMQLGQFREDLYYRLNVVPIEMPTLAERREDLPLLVQHLLQRYNQRANPKRLGFSAEALVLLCSYEYPGNVRELENIVERSAALSRTDVIGVESLPTDLQELAVVSGPRSPARPRSLEEVEREHIETVLRECGGNRTRAAQLLGINRVSLYRKLKAWQFRD